MLFLLCPVFGEVFGALSNWISFGVQQSVSQTHQFCSTYTSLLSSLFLIVLHLLPQDKDGLKARFIIIKCIKITSNINLMVGCEFAVIV
jgi:hypothetical protein